MIDSFKVKAGVKNCEFKYNISSKNKVLDLDTKK